MNNIMEVRSEIREFFDQGRLIDGSQFTSFSSSKNYKLETVSYEQTKADANWVVTKVNIYDSRSNALAFEFMSDNDRFFHEWLIKDGHEFLICGEVLCGGQTVVDLSSGEMESYCPNEDGFIWTEFFLSPAGNRLAVIGCHWACPYEIRIYNFSNPLMLPLPEVVNIPLEDNEKGNIEWIDDDCFKIECYDGSFRTHSLGNSYS